MKVLLVDGYNVIHRHPRLSRLMETDPEAAREGLLRELTSLGPPLHYRVLMVVFDAAASRNVEPVVEERGGIITVYTRRGQTADAFIEGAVRRLVREGEVEVATSDRVLRSLVTGFGAGGMGGEDLFRRSEEARALAAGEAGRRTSPARAPLEEWLDDEVRGLLEKLRFG